MAFQAKQRVVSAHAQPVVNYPDQAASAGLDFDSQIRRFGIEGIFDQLLYHAGRSLNDLSRRNLIGDLLGQ
jgi:hypothetical protein